LVRTRFSWIEVKIGERIVLKKYMSLACVGALLALAGLPELSHVGLHAQAAQRLSFEVASIKSADTDVDAVAIEGGCVGIDSPPNRLPTVPLGRCRFINFPVNLLVAVAYRERDEFNLQVDWTITNMPNWTKSAAFNIEAKAESPAKTTEGELLEMVRSLLADRFRLSFHREMREVSGLALTLAKGGHKLRLPAGERAGIFGGPGQTATGKAASSTAITTFVSRQLGLPISDRTGLTDLYDFNLMWVSDSDTSGPSFLTALEEQVGLRLEKAKIMIPVVVIDNLDKPTLN
jgi:uncharacterized protein (TIGR03435 family)